MVFAVAALALVTGSAWAAGHAKPAGSGSTAGNAGGGTGGHSDTVSVEAERDDKPWEFGATVETHRLVIQNDLEGSASNKQMNFLFLYGRWEPTKHDAFEVRTYVYQRFLADQGETGVRTDDTTLYYAHYFDLPHDLSARTYGALTIPSSFTSEKMSLYTAPRVGGGLKWAPGPWKFEWIAYGEAYIVKYREMEGGNPNTKWHASTLLEAEYRLPVAVPLTLGATGVVHRYWYYEVAHAPAADQPFFGAVADSQFPSQPVQGGYGYQTYVRWDIPRLWAVNSDLTIAYGQGDSTLGYTSVLHDGLSHYYGFWRTSSQVYAALSLRL